MISLTKEEVTLSTLPAGLLCWSILLRCALPGAWRSSSEAGRVAPSTRNSSRASARAFSLFLIICIMKDSMGCG